MGCSSHAGLRLGTRLAKILVAMRHPGKLEGLGGGAQKSRPLLFSGRCQFGTCYSSQNRCAIRVLPVDGAASCEHREGRWERSAPQAVISG